MEASIMDGTTMNCGAVSGLTTVVNAVSLARLVMEKTPHIYLAFDGAEEFARQQVTLLSFPFLFIVTITSISSSLIILSVQGVETLDSTHFITAENIERLKQAIEANRVQVLNFENKHAFTLLIFYFCHTYM